VAKGWDHDPPATAKLVPFGILMVATGALMLLFGSYETSDAWVDALRIWWRQVRRGHRHVKRLVIYLDNGPKNSGRRTQFLKRMVQFADWSGLEIHLVYYPPYHSKYNPVERCWSALERVLVHREMEKPGLGDKVDCTLDQRTSIGRLDANPEGERQGGIVPPPFGLGPWVGARVVSPRCPILRPGRPPS
jgi:hypothetical protein